MTSALLSSASAPVISTAPEALTAYNFSTHSDYVTTVSHRVEGLKEIYLPKQPSDLRVTFVFESEEATDRSFEAVKLEFQSACIVAQHSKCGAINRDSVIFGDLLRGSSLVPTENRYADDSPCTLSYKTKHGFGLGDIQIATQNELVGRLLREFEFASPPSTESREIKVLLVQEVTSIKLCQ